MWLLFRTVVLNFLTIQTRWAVKDEFMGWIEPCDCQDWAPGVWCCPFQPFTLGLGPGDCGAPSWALRTGTGPLGPDTAPSQTHTLGLGARASCHPYPIQSSNLVQGLRLSGSLETWQQLPLLPHSQLPRPVGSPLVLDDMVSQDGGWAFLV